MLSSLKNSHLAARATLVALLAALLTAGAASASSYTITLDGSALVVTTTSCGEKATIRFAGTAGQRVSLRTTTCDHCRLTVSS